MNNLTNYMKIKNDRKKDINCMLLYCFVLNVSYILFHLFLTKHLWYRNYFESLFYRWGNWGSVSKDTSFLEHVHWNISSSLLAKSVFPISTLSFMYKHVHVGVCVCTHTHTYTNTLPNICQQHYRDLMKNSFLWHCAEHCL